jgi:Golgi phosphoprotein 3 (GPP34)
VDLAGGVAVRVAALCLDDRGRLPDRLLTGTAVRGGLLLDLALSGRVESSDDSITVDAAPTGFAPADRLLAAIEVEPERSLDGWLEERRLRVREVAGAAVASGRWRVSTGPFGVGRSYTDLAAEATAADRARCADRAGPPPRSPWDAAVTAVAVAAGLAGAEAAERPPAPLVAATGPAAWLCAAVVDHLLLADERYRSQAGALGGGIGPF